MLLLLSGFDLRGYDSSCSLQLPDRIGCQACIFRVYGGKMKYQKPEIRLLGDAAVVIQGCEKIHGGSDFDNTLGFTTLPNYDLDE